MKNTIDGINSRITEAKEWRSNLEDKMVEFTATEQNKKNRMKRNEDGLRDLEHNINCTNILIIGSQKEKREKKDPRKYLRRLQLKNSLTWERK